MSQQAPVEPLVSVVPAPEVGLNVFTNEIPPWTPGKGVRGIFGGFLIAQAVRAAQLSTAPTFAVHALQSVFLKPGKATSQIYYHVDRLADGRSFATRLVRTVQDGAVIFVATVGLQRQDPAGGTLPFRNLEHAVPPPHMDGKGPDDVAEASTDRLLFMVGFKTSTSEGFIEDPFEWRHLLDRPEGEQQQQQQQPAAPHSFRLRSMHHNVLFHDAGARADGWLISERRTSWAGEGRVLVEQRFWSLETGRLVLSCWQEGLVRLKDDSKL
uniref:Acyl-CoA thioesterase II n=1 Tax=Pyricularia oryzae (strain P131) TaxID=1143193 RepID=L7IVJ9_PYRO1